MQLQALLCVALVACFVYPAAARPGPSLNDLVVPKGQNKVKFSFKGEGGALKTLGTERLGRIKQKSGFKGELAALIASLDHDDDLGVDTETDELMFQCEGLSANASAAEIASATAPGSVDPTLTVAEVFSLSSRPGAAQKILLDFDGNVLTGSSWNKAKNLDKIVTPPYDKDNDTTTFSAAELSDMVAIWRSVAEDYSIWDVDVTLKDPGNDALVNNGIRVAIGGHSSEWYGNAGGVAYVGSFGKENTPCFIFPKNLGPNYPKFVWEAISHEVGHTLGLLHDGQKASGTNPGTGYYTGTENGNWAPIMGVGYYKEVVQFDKGEFPGANNPQDDIAVVSATLSPLPQKNGISIATATALQVTTDGVTATGTGAGIVSQPGQQDYFTFRAAAGVAFFSADVIAPYSTGLNRANLNVQLTIYNALGVAIGSINPPDAVGVPTPVPLQMPTAGTYYLSVAGAGSGDPMGDGYSSYGSLGQFSVKVTFPDGSGATAVPVDCIGQWSEWSVCSQECTQTATYVVTRPAADGGTACEAVVGAQKIQACSGQQCQATAPPSPSAEAPSPPEAPASLMRVASIIIRKVVTGPANNRKVTCRAVVVVKDSSGANLRGVRVTAGWNSVSTTSTYDLKQADVATASNGQAVFKSKAAPATTGGTCTFTVNSVVLPGYVLDSGVSVVTKQLSW